MSYSQFQLPEWIYGYQLRVLIGLIIFLTPTCGIREFHIHFAVFVSLSFLLSFSLSFLPCHYLFYYPFYYLFSVFQFSNYPFFIFFIILFLSFLLSFFYPFYYPFLIFFHTDSQKILTVGFTRPFNSNPFSSRQRSSFGHFYHLFLSSVLRITMPARFQNLRWQVVQPNLQYPLIRSFESRSR